MLVAACAALAAFGGWRFARASAPISGPVVLVSVDALRADRLPAYGHASGRTPAIDALAADGVVFERAYAHAPLTLPSHASLLSGRLPFQTRVRDNAGFVLDDDQRMLAEILRDRGYATGAVVSSFALRRATGIDQGFSFFDDGSAPGVSPSDVWRDAAASELIAEQWLTATASPRAFLFLHLAGPPRLLSDDAAADARLYDESVSAVDEVVGRLVKYLKAHQLYDQSTIVLVSDHGEGLGDHGENGHGLLVYDEALRVPFIVKPSASEESGRRVEDVVQLADIAPTVLDLAKAPVPGDLAGQSLVPILAGYETFPARIVYSESMYPYYAFGWSGLTTVTDGRFRVIVPSPAGPQDPPYAAGAEIFDHATDPRERTSIDGGAEPAVAALRAELERLTTAGEPAEPGTVHADDHERYEALGYVGATAFREAPPAADVERVHPRDKTRLVNTWRHAIGLGIEGDWAGALASLKAALALEPGSADLWGEVVLASAFAGRLEQTLAALKELQTLDPTPGVAGYLEARALQARGRHQQAVAAFELALAGQQQPGARAIPGVRSGAAESLARLYRYEEAEYLFLEEIKRFPHNPRARSGLAALYKSTGRPDEAAALLAQ